MKITLVMLVGLAILTLIIISAFQLLKILFKEMLDMTTEAWTSPEQH